MLTNEIRQRIEDSLEEAEVSFEGEGCALSLTVVSASFAGLSAVKRQQRVYSFLADLIADGSLHAVTLRLFTPEEMTPEGKDAQAAGSAPQGSVSGGA